MATTNRMKKCPAPLNLSLCSHAPSQNIISPSFIDIIHNVDEAIESKLFNYEQMQLIANNSAIEMHIQWENIPCIGKMDDIIDVIDFFEFFNFYYNMALFVATYMQFYSYNDIDEISAVIHTKWLLMNISAKNGHMDVPYKLLSETNKEYIRNIFRIVNSFY